MTPRPPFSGRCGSSPVYTTRPSFKNEGLVNEGLVFELGWKCSYMNSLHKRINHSMVTFVADKQKRQWL